MVRSIWINQIYRYVKKCTPSKRKELPKVSRTLHFNDMPLTPLDRLKRPSGAFKYNQSDPIIEFLRLWDARMEEENRKRWEEREREKIRREGEKEERFMMSRQEEQRRADRNFAREFQKPIMMMMTMLHGKNNNNTTSSLSS